MTPACEHEELGWPPSEGAALGCLACLDREAELAEWYREQDQEWKEERMREDGRS